MLLAASLFSVTAHSRALESWIDKKGREFAEASRTGFTRDGYFIDDNDRLLIEELPRADYSKGGVYLFGTSTVRCATQLWELPASERSLIHNYGISQSDYTCQSLFVKHLIESASILKAGGDKNLFIFAGSYHHLSRRFDPNGFFTSLWSRHGLFRYSEDSGLQSTPRSRLWQVVHFELNRISGCALRLREIVHLQFRRWIHGDEKLRRRPDPEEVKSQWRDRMGSDWRAKIDEGLAEFARLIPELRERKVNLLIVLLPIGGLEKDLPFHSYYRANMEVLCEKFGVPLIDWSSLLTDEDLQDTSHANIFGARKLQREFLSIALPFLHSTGALP